jgi:hypothetical protein
MNTLFGRERFVKAAQIGTKTNVIIPMQKSWFPPVAFSALIAKDYAASLGFETQIVAVFLFCVVASLFVAGAKGNLLAYWQSIPGFVKLPMLICSVSCTLYSYLIFDRVNTSPYIWSFWLAFALSAAGGRYLLFLVVALPLVNLPLQLYESYTGNVLFTTIAKVGDYIELGSAEWSIGDGALRTKGLFQGPLHVATIFLFAVLLSVRQPILRFLMAVGTFVAAARLGLVIAVTFVLDWIVRYLRNSRSVFLFTVISIASIAGAIVIANSLAGLQSSRTDFISLLFDFQSNDSNLTRLVVWQLALNFYLNYDFASLLFGKFNEIRNTFDAQGLGGGAESDWLYMLVDDGFVTFYAYLVTFVYLIYSTYRHDRIRLPIVLMIFVSMNLFPCISFLAGATEFWIVFFFLCQFYYRPMLVYGSS